MKEIRYSPKGFTQSNNEYVTLTEQDMAYLMNQAILTMSAYSELTCTSQGAGIVLQRDKAQFGKRGKSAIAPGRENTRLSVLGGFVTNYFKKQESFRNDISASQLPYIANVLNECCEQLGFEALVFRSELFNWGE
ncbi:hypothetical protein UFOVP641_17 [uncultured Caudovirales phage]|uniref:Uncharacterized protein n=1 Tax=uncultured Caudovirales phage TaxID=2100421 RepID=A0A6J5N991_9CAUD|nr:hypothetical protein UFOVP641_17 [uncultured Caudovirales phage]